MSKFCFIGNCFTEDGFGSHTLQLMLHTAKKVGLENVSYEGPRPQNWEENLQTPLWDILQNKFKPEECVAIAITSPSTWPLFASDRYKKFYGFLIAEGNRLPYMVEDYCNHELVDEVLVPSCHTLEAAKATNVKKKVSIVPHGVDTELFKRNEGLPSLLEGAEDKFVFLFNKGYDPVKGWADRGGFLYAAKAFTNTFSRDDKVVLLCKLNASYLPPGFDIKKHMGEMGIPEDGAEIRVVTHNVPYEALPSFYSCGDVQFSVQLADAFGLTNLEGMSCGLPQLLVGWGGQVDFVRPNVHGFYIGHTLQPSEELEDVMWAKPNEANIKQLLRYCFNNQEKVKRMGLACREQVESFTWDKSVEKLLKFVN